MDSKEKNFQMPNKTFFLPLQINPAKIFRWKTELGDPAVVADDYEAAIHTVFPNEFPAFDLIFLGMGSDGHTASLFPNTAGLDVKDRIAVKNAVTKLDTTRLTLTFPVINAAHNAAILVAGADKAEMLARVLEGDADFHELPSRGVKPTSGKLFWFVDAAAAKNVTT